MGSKKRHEPLFVDDDEPESKSLTISKTPEIKELTTNILGFGSRFGKPWTREEDCCLLQLLKKGNSIDQIASKICRSAVSIGCRLRSEFNCKYKTMQGSDTFTSLGFDKDDISARITAFGDVFIKRIDELVCKQAENPSNMMAIEPPPRIKSDKPDKPPQKKPIDELLSLLREINGKLDLLIERTT